MEFLPSKKRGPTIDLSPLVDVVFLLIIFFTVSTTFREGTGLPVTLPRAGTATTLEEGPLEVTISRSGEIAVGGTVLPDIDALRARLEQELAGSDRRRISLRSDKDAPFGLAVSVMDVARQLGLENVGISARPGGAQGGAGGEERP